MIVQVRYFHYKLTPNDSKQLLTTPNDPKPAPKKIFLGHFHYKFTPNDSKQVQKTPKKSKNFKLLQTTSNNPKRALREIVFELFSLQIHSKQT